MIGTCARLCRRDLLAIAAGLLVPAPLVRPIAALAARPGAEQVVQDLARVDRLMALLEAHTDVDLISRLALGRYWSELPETQQKDYQQLFRDVVIRSLARRLNGYAPDAQDPIEKRFQILGSAPAGKSDTLVRSKVFPQDGPPVALDWRVREGDAGAVIIDVIVEGASLLVSQRSEFAAVIERHDLNGLLAELRARAASAPS